MNKIVTMLEAMIHIHCQNDGLIYTPRKSFLTGMGYDNAIGYDKFHLKKTAINVPGIYTGRNMVQMKHKYSGMYKWYKEGIVNRTFETPYPDTALLSCDGFKINFIPPMRAKHLRRDGNVVDSDSEEDKKLTEKKMKGNYFAQA